MQQLLKIYKNYILKKAVENALLLLLYDSWSMMNVFYGEGGGRFSKNWIKYQILIYECFFSWFLFLPKTIFLFINIAIKIIFGKKLFEGHNNFK